MIITESIIYGMSNSVLVERESEITRIFLETVDNRSNCVSFMEERIADLDIQINDLMISLRNMRYEMNLRDLGGLKGGLFSRLKCRIGLFLLK